MTDPDPETDLETMRDFAQADNEDRHYDEEHS